MVDDFTAVGLVPSGGSQIVRGLQVGRAAVPPKLHELIDAAAAKAQRVPVVLGPRAGGETKAGGLSVAKRSDGRLELNSLPLVRRTRSAAAQLGRRVAVVLSAEPEQRRCRVWLAAPTFKLVDLKLGVLPASLEAGALPSGVSQLSEAALASDAWEIAGRDTALGSLDAIFSDAMYACSSRSNGDLFRVSPLAVPPLVKAAVEKSGGPHAWVFLGPPSCGEAGRNASVKVALLPDGQLDVKSLQLMRLLLAAKEAAAAAGTPLVLVLRAEEARGACRLWLAPAGSTGRALEAPMLPAGIAQLTEAALASAPGSRPTNLKPSAWTLIDGHTAVGGLKSPLNDPIRVRIPTIAVPAIAQGIAAAAGGAAPLHLGPPDGRPAAAAALKANINKNDGRLEINSAPLLRLLVASDIAAEAAGGATLELVFRADPTLRACFLWLAPAGSRGRALTAPVLPAGVAQLSSAALKKRK
jgi:hypothetical protein